MAARNTRLIKLGLDFLREALAQLNAPLIERVDVPHCTLGESEMLVVDDERTQGSWCNLLGKDGSGWAVAEERLVLVQLCWRVLGFELLLAFSDHKCFGLSEEIRGEHLLMFVVCNWIVGLGGKNEIGWDELGSLMEELIEGVLRVGCWFTEENWTSRILDHLVVAGHSLSVGLHGQLLEVSWETVEVLVESTKDESRAPRKVG